MSSITARTFSQAFADARAIGLLNEATASVYTDAVLLPHGAYVHNEIQEEFASNGIPLAETVTESLTYAANAETIVIPAGVTDLSAPLEIWEKGTSDSLWVQMERVGNLRAPLVSSRARIYQWEWRNGTIAVLACQTARDIFCRYRRQLEYPAADDPMDFDGIYFALGAGTAFYAATSRPDVQAKAGAMYAKRLATAIHIASRDMQSVTYRQSSWRGRGNRRTHIQEPA